MRTFEPYAYAFLRIVTGFLFATHGSMKLLGWPSGGGAGGGSLPPLIVAAGVIELLGGLLVLAGLFTRPAAFLASGTMAVAYFMAHASGGWSPVINKGELAVVYAFLFLFLATRGGGVWSLDALRTKTAATA